VLAAEAARLGGLAVTAKPQAPRGFDRSGVRAAGGRVASAEDPDRTFVGRSHLRPAAVEDRVGSDPLVNLTSAAAVGRIGGDSCTMYSGRKPCRTLVQVGSGRAVGMVAFGLKCG